MRSLGKRLGVEAMSLYNHVSNKDEILDGALDLVLEEIAIPSADAQWRVAMKERAASARSAFKIHPWASTLLDSRVSSSPARLRYYDAILGALRKAGFSIDLAARAFSLLDSYVYGFCRQSLAMAVPDDTSQEIRAEAFHNLIAVDAYPYLAQMAESSMSSGYDEEADFEFGLTLILDGLARLV